MCSAGTVWQCRAAMRRWLAWCGQSLSYTDGTSDALPELVAALEEENRTRCVRWRQRVALRCIML